MERATVLQQGGAIGLEHLPDNIRQQSMRLPRPPGPAGTGAPVRDVREQLDRVEYEAIVSALEDANGNQTHAAKAMGISRRSLIYKMEKYGLKPMPKGRR